MAELTCGERVVRCLTGQDIDRVPYGVGLGWQPWEATLDRWRSESGDPCLDPAAVLGFDQGFVVPDVHPGIYPPFSFQVLEESADFVVYRDERGITRRDRRDRGSIPEWLGFPVQDESDWERIKVERLQPDTPGRLPEDWDAFRARLAQTGEAVQVGRFPWGVFGTPRDLLGAEELLVSFCTRPYLVRDMMEHLTWLWISIYERVADEVQIDHLHIWEDMSAKQGSLISPHMVREFMMPCYDRLAGFCDAAGVRLMSVDTDGQCAELVPIMAAHGVNYMFPFEVQAGNDILAYRRDYPELGIMGGLDKRALSGAPSDVDRQVRLAAEMISQGRYLPGFDHLIPPDATWENFGRAAHGIRDIIWSAAGQ